LKIAAADQSVVLSWPLWATNFALQQSGDATSPAAIWANVPGTVGVTNNENALALPLDDAVKFFRLRRP
jgi:hypothetical protein